MSPHRRQRLAHLLIFVTPALWSANYVVARSAIGIVEPHMLAFLRWLMAFGLMLPLAWPALRTAWPAWRTEWKDLLVLGALGMWICGAFVYIGAQTTTATNIGLIYAICPVLIAAASALLFGDRLGPLQSAGVAMALAGVLLVLARGSPGNLLAVRFTMGDLWVVAAALSWTVYSILLRRRASALDPFARLTVITLGGLVVLAPLTVAEALVLGVPEVSLRALGLAAVVAVLPGFGAYQAYSFMQRELGAARTGLVLYLGPLYAAGVAWWLLGEAPAWFHYVSAALILPGIWLATREPGRPPVPHAAGAGRR